MPHPCCRVLVGHTGGARLRAAATSVCAALALLLVAAPGFAPAAELRVLELEPLEDLQANGHLHLPVQPGSVATLSVDLGGLAPESTYMLCLDAETAETPASARLGALVLAGWPPGNFWETQGIKKGFWDFARVETDSEGRVAQAFELPLPPLDYRVRLLVKRMEPHGGMVSVLQSPVLLLEVHSPLRQQRWMLALVAAVACPIPLLWLLQLRRRRRNAPIEAFALSDTREETRALAGPIAAPATASPLVAVGNAEPPRTRVDRARADGVLVHHRNLSWIEIHGRRKSFRPRQALVFRILMESDPDCEGMLQEEIVKAWEKVYAVARANPVRVRDIFRACKDEPGDFIVRVPGPASAYRLRLEPHTPSAVTPEPDDAASDDDGADPDGELAGA